MAGLAASRRDVEGPGNAGNTAAADEAFSELAAASREVRAVIAESGSGFMLGQALMRLTEATTAAEDLSRWKIAAVLVENVAASRDGHLTVVR